MSQEEELDYWRNVGENLLTDSQLDAEMKWGYSWEQRKITPREVLGGKI